MLILSNNTDVSSSAVFCLSSRLVLSEAYSTRTSLAEIIRSTILLTVVMMLLVIHHLYLLGKLLSVQHTRIVYILKSLAFVMTVSCPSFLLVNGTDMFISFYFPHLSVRIVRLCDYEGWGDSVSAVGTDVVVRSSRMHTPNDVGVADMRRSNPVIYGRA